VVIGVIKGVEVVLVDNLGRFDVVEVRVDLRVVVVAVREGEGVS